MQPASAIQIWDPVLRLLHWVTAVGFVLNYWVLEPGAVWHQRTGYLLAVVVLLRTCWGVLGPPTARFSLQALSLSHWQQHLRELRARQLNPNAGHNPFGYLWLYLTLALFSILALSGFLLEEVDLFFGSDWPELVHGFMADLLFVLVCVHVSAVLLLGWWGRIELIFPMLTGKRRF